MHTLGVKGDGVTIDVTAINAAIRNAPAKTTLYFPAGTYLLNDALKIFRSDLTLLGDGDATVLKSVAGSYHVQVGSGQAYSGISFQKLQFLGTPNQYMADGTARGGCLLFGCKGTSFIDCLFRGCAEPILNAGATGGTYGTSATNCRILGWGRMAIFCNGGERISHCQLVQDDPNLYGERSSHGFYIHSGSQDVEIADTEIANVRKYAIQLYGENDPNPIQNIRLLRLQIKNCANGIISAHGAATAGIVRNALIDGCTITGTYAGSSVAIKNGEGVIVRGCTIDGNTGAASGHTGAGIYAGVWAPYEPNFSLKDVQITGNVVKGCDRGIWTLPSNGGTFTNITITGNQVSGCRVNYDITGPGVTMVPGIKPPTGPPGTALPPAPVTLNPGDMVMVGGQAYRVGYGLYPEAVTPIPIPPPPPPPPPPGGGWIDGWRDGKRDWTLKAQEGDTVFLIGGGFGVQAGVVMFDQVVKGTVVSWSNSEVAVRLPHVSAQPHVPFVQVLNPTGNLLATQSAGALTIVPLP